MIGRVEIQRLARGGQVDERTQERDYVLAWLLAGVANGSTDLVFKGGTCLRRCYIRGYRYSEDLDFTVLASEDGVPIVTAVASWCRWIADHAGIQATADADATLNDRRAWVSFDGPLGTNRERAIKVDFSPDEAVIDQIANRPLLSEYSDLPDGAFTVASYSLAEIYAEKTRSLMQRAEPRDLYDLNALSAHARELPSDARALFDSKARARGLEPRDLAHRLADREPVLRRNWHARLHDQVMDVPEFESTWRAVRRSLRQAGYLD